MCEWMRMVPQKTASIRGFRLPPMKGASVRGTMATETRRSNVQWYDPWVASGGGTFAASFAIEWIRKMLRLQWRKHTGSFD